jgi:hypothetical protein
MKIHLDRQLSIALENQPGRLAHICHLLAEGGVNIDGVCVIDNVEQGMVRLMTNNAAAARAILEHAGLHVVEAEVLVLELRDQLGKLARLSEALGEAGINIEYAYGTVDHQGAQTRLILKTQRARKAHTILAGLGEE